jgi:hypothetical protein
VSGSSPIRLWLAVPLLTAASGLMLLPGLLLGPSRDPAVFSAIGQAIVHGHVPYLDVWDHKLPGIYLVDAAAQLVTGGRGDPWIGAWIVSAAATTMTGAGVLVIAQRLGVRPLLCLIAGLASILASAQYAISEGGGFTEQVGVAFAVWALVAAGVRSRRRMFAAGVLSSLALGTTPLLIPAFAAVVVLVLSNAPRAGRWTSLAWAVVGAAVPGFAVCVWLGLHGALPAMWDAVVTYNVAYRASEAHALDRSITLVRSIAAPLAFVIVPAVVGLTSLISIARGAGPRARDAVAVLVWLAASVCLLILGSALYAHYFIPLLVPLAVAGAAGMEYVAERYSARMSGGRRLPTEMTAVMVVALATSIVTGTVRGANLAAYYSALQSRAEAVAAEVDRVTAPSASIFVWGNQARIYSLADRSSATRFLYLYPLTTPGYSSVSQVSEVLSQLRERPPAVFVDAGSTRPGDPGTPPLLITRPSDGEGRDLDLLSALRAFVVVNYREVNAGGGWPIYEWAAP